MNQTIKIALTEDHRGLRQTLAKMLNDEEGIEVIFEANNGRELLDNLEKEMVDVVILDLEMPVMDGREALHIIRKKYDDKIKIIIFSSHYGEGYIRKFMLAGANAYLAKEVEYFTLVTAIKSVHEVGHFFHDKLSPELVAEIMSEKKNTYPVLEGELLSDREIQVVKLLCKGLSNLEIGEKLDLSYRTIENHRHRILKKIGGHNSMAIMEYAVKKGYHVIKY